MILRAYSLFDNKGLMYSPPFFAPTDGAAVRIVRDTVQDTNTSVGRHPADYVLYLVGEYDDSKGLFVSAMPLVHIVDCAALTPNVSAENMLPFPKKETA